MRRWRGLVVLAVLWSVLGWLGWRQLPTAEERALVRLRECSAGWYGSCSGSCEQPKTKQVRAPMNRKWVYADPGAPEVHRRCISKCAQEHFELCKRRVGWTGQSR